jgi:uncharacterized protein with gpF-like domain
MTISATRPECVLRPVHPNAGIEAAYRKRLQEMARRMAADILRKLATHYRPAAERLAQDDDPIVTLRRMLRMWGIAWQKRFDDMAKDIAASFAGQSQRYTDAAIRRRMREAGFTVRFRPTERMVSAYRAVVAENVALIKSVPQEFAKDVQSAVWRSVMKGGAMGELSTEIRKKYGVTYRRAAFISRDQVAKSKAVLENARRAEIGIVEAQWQHSNAGKVPRPSHVKAGRDKVRFKIADGWYDPDEGKRIQPGELINCRCTSRSVIPGLLRA